LDGDSQERTGGRGGDIGWLASTLPPVRRIERRSEADYYGAGYLIAEALGLATPPRSIASWKHGVSFVRRMAAPELLLTEGNRATRHLVANEWQASALREAGFVRAHAVGAPYLYAQADGVRRMPRSLLAMPAHHIAGVTHSFDERGYAQALRRIADRFDVVVACISSASVQAGSWTSALQDSGIPWIVGADSHDANALRRMRHLFAMFEFVTTNTLGSHVAYAAYSGCRVSIWGPYAEIKVEDYASIPWYRQRWDRVAELIATFSESHVRKRAPLLFRDPWDAADLKSWAEPFLGDAFRRSPGEVARLLGWTRIGRAELLAHSAAKFGLRVASGMRRRLRPRAAPAPTPGR
jgi:hypothetical protein